MTNGLTDSEITQATHSSPLVLIVVAMLWGFTNPLIKITGHGIANIQRNSKLEQFLAELKFLATNVKYVAAFATNQLGSVLYLFALQDADLSIASPITTALTFIFTHCSGSYLGEPLGNKKMTLAGVLCIIFGISLCVLDKKLQGHS